MKPRKQLLFILVCLLILSNCSKSDDVDPTCFLNDLPNSNDTGSIQATFEDRKIDLDKEKVGASRTTQILRLNDGTTSEFEVAIITGVICNGENYDLFQIGILTANLEQFLLDKRTASSDATAGGRPSITYLENEKSSNFLKNILENKNQDPTYFSVNSETEIVIDEYDGETNLVSGSFKTYLVLKDATSIADGKVFKGTFKDVKLEIPSTN